MILTVTELPKTIPDDVVIQGMTSMVVSEDEGFLPVDIEIAQGRNIYPLPTMTCYKIEANLGGIYAEIIAIAQKRFNSTTLVDENFQPVPIWPIFVKYDIATPENVNYRRTYACFETINDMFHFKVKNVFFTVAIQNLFSWHGHGKLILKKKAILC